MITKFFCRLEELIKELVEMLERPRVLKESGLSYSLVLRELLLLRNMGPAQKRIKF